MPQFFAELQRRRVIRVAGVYAVAAWAIIQVSDTVLPRLGLPDWTVTLVIVLVALGAPLALILAWAFDVGPDGITRTESATAAPASGTKFGRIAVAGAVVVLAGVGIAFYAKGRASDLPEGRVAVAVFENRTGDPTLTAIGRLAADFIIRGLTETGQVAVAGTPAELNSEDKKNTTEDQIRILAHKAGAGVVVTGSLYREGDSVLIVAQVSDARKASLLRTIGPVSFGATSSKSMSGVEQMRQLATGGIVALVSPAGNGFVRVSEAAHLPTWESYRYYLQGVLNFQARDFIKSAEAFEKSYLADTLFLLPVIRSAYAWGNMANSGGGAAKVDSIGKWLEPRRDRLSAFELAYLDRVVARTRGDNAAAYRASHELLRLRPESPNAQYLAGRDAIPVNRPAEAVAMISRIDRDAPELPEGIDLDRDEAVALHLLGKHRKELKVITRALQRYPGNIDGLAVKLSALCALGRIEEANRVADELELQPVTTGATSPGGALMTAANELVVHGYTQEAPAMAARAVAWFKARHSPGGLVANALLAAGQAREAAAVMDTATGRDTVALLTSRALVAAALHDTRKAEEIDAQIAALEYTGRPFTKAASRARIAAALGQKQSALLLLREAFASGLQFGMTPHNDPLLHKLAGYKPYDDLMRPRD